MEIIEGKGDDVSREEGTRGRQDNAAKGVEFSAGSEGKGVVEEGQG
jgi:hypothetical protein